MNSATGTALIPSHADRPSGLPWSGFEKGILTTADTDGIELTWGNVDAALKLIEKIALREGIAISSLKAR